jgi:hypothetical protein
MLSEAGSGEPMGVASRTMRRALTVFALTVLALAMIAPAAQSRQKERFFQDLSLNGPFPGEIAFSVIYQDRHGNGKFRPGWAIGYSLDAQVSCDPGGPSDLIIAKNSANPVAHFKQRLTRGRFATRFEAELSPQLAPPHGDLTGKVLKGKVNGAFNVEDWDPNPGGRENCVSSGSFSATPCKSGDPRFIDQKIPVCRFLQ